MVRISDINSLVGNHTGIEIPTVLVKWITYALFLHIVALALAAGSAVFGLLAHIREMAMTCCSTCISGFAAVVALVAFIFDIALFFIAKARINAVGKASIGNAVWLTLAAWVLLFLSGCFYTLGRCCISTRKPRSDWDRRKDAETGPPVDQMRLDAVKAEADRKARQKQTEVGLPAFSESQPLTAVIDGDHVYSAEQYQDHLNNTSPGYDGRPAQGGGYVGGGYMQGPPGERAMDEYYSPTTANNVGASPYNYPPQRQNTALSGHARSDAPSMYAQSTYSYQSPNPASPPPPLPNTQYLAPISQQYGRDVPGREYGHTAGGTTCTSCHLCFSYAFNVHLPTDHSATSHMQDASNYATYDPYNSHQYQQQTDQPLVSPALPTPNYSNQTSFYSADSTPPVQRQPERSYTLGGDGYGGNSVPPLPEHRDSNYFYGNSSPTPINTNIAPPSSAEPGVVGQGPRSPGGPRPLRVVSPEEYGDNPPEYEQGSSHIPGAWGKH